ncbi:alpha/beta fold hydrolase [Halovivax sp.]|uniref:alpha/beta fold hydrolase n=1 Tax=Halovivax sp. TaxID=1935978 RepID=UPI0025B81EAD|nr:alpha/beta hydrolase [Halovivax sp.]
MSALTLDDGTIHYETAGDGDPLVFVHGGWMDGNAWYPQVERFADEHRTITLDVRGHGRTGATAADRYSIELFADDLEALLAHLDVDRPALVGLSLGSMVVQEYLHRHPDRARGAVLGGPVRSMPPVPMPTSAKPLFSPIPAISTSLALAGQEATFRSMLAGIRATTGAPWLALDREVRERAIRGVADVPAREYRKVFDALYRYDAPALDGVETPTLAVYGDHEACPVKRQGDAIASSVATGDRVEIPDAGHLVNQDRVEAFNRVLADFLARVPAS